MSSSSSILEKELTCSICTDLLYDPVTFLDCLHTNCGSCAKSWFQSLCNNAANAPIASSASPPAVAKYTCPVCRSIVRATKHNSTLQSLIEDFIGRNPEKDRTPEEKAALRKVHTPGSGVLPGESRSSSSASSPPPSLPNRRPSAQNARPAPSSSRSAPALNTNRRNSARNHSASSSNGLPAYYWESLALNPEQTCFHCRKRVDYAARCRCPQCDIITCSDCYRNGKSCRNPAANHVLVMQKLQMQPRRHIQSGVFCDICETWCDNSGSVGDLNCYFWACEVCDNGNWAICRTCVSKGNSCSHELKLYSNNRASSGGGFVRGNTGENHYQIFEELAQRMGSRNIDLHTQLNAFGYIRNTNFNVICDKCDAEIPPDHSYLHCTECMDSQWDMCMGCWYLMADEIGEGEDDGTFKCRAGHQMALLSQNGQKGTHKVIQDIPHDPPEYVAKTPVVNANEDWWAVNRGAKTGVAIKSHWPETQNPEVDTVYKRDTPGIRPRDFGGLLGFPEQAEISNIWVAFTEGDGSETVEYLWGWYGGLGGIFPRDCVRFTD